MCIYDFKYFLTTCRKVLDTTFAFFIFFWLLLR